VTESQGSHLVFLPRSNFVERGLHVAVFRFFFSDTKSWRGCLTDKGKESIVMTADWFILLTFACVHQLNQLIN
jgi:hypothetical protein